MISLSPPFTNVTMLYYIHMLHYIHMLYYIHMFPSTLFEISAEKYEIFGDISSKT